MTAAVFLDRDNTLIHNDGDLGDPDKVRLIKGAASAVASLQGLGYKVIVVTNQGGVARGKYTEQDVDAVHRRVNELIQANSGAFIDRFYYCPYHPEGSERRYRREHPWRKPKPGMLLQAGKHLSLSMNQCWMVGDQIRDIQAGYAAGVTPILIDPTGEKAGEVQSMPPTRNGDDDAVEPVSIVPNRDYFVARNLIEAARIIGQKRRPASSAPAHVEKKPSRIVVEESPPAKPAAAAKRKVVKKKVRRRRTEDDVQTETANEAKPVQQAVSQPAAQASSRGESPAAPPRPEPSHQHQDHDDEDHAPTLTMPSLAPDIDLDDDDDVPRVDVDQSKRNANDAAEQRQQRAEQPGSTSAVQKPGAKQSPPANPPKPIRQDQHISPPNTPPAKQPVATEPATATSQSDDLSSDQEPTNVDQTLRQILQELRNQRLTGHEFSYIGVMAIVFQVVAIICLLAALLMGSGNDQIFTRWIACAVVLQLGTIAMLLFKR